MQGWQVIDHNTFHPPDTGSAATTTTTTYVLQDLTRARQWPISKGLCCLRPRLISQRGCPGQGCSDDTALALYERPALPSQGIFFFLFLFVITEETQNDGKQAIGVSSTVLVGVLLPFKTKEWIAFFFYVIVCVCIISESQLLRTTSRCT